MYFLEIINQNTDKEDLIIKPVMFKTVYRGKEKFVWQLRRMVFRLKLFDFVLYQSEQQSKKYSIPSGPSSQFF